MDELRWGAKADLGWPAEPPASPDGGGPGSPRALLALDGVTQHGRFPSEAYWMMTTLALSLKLLFSKVESTLSGCAG